MYLSTRLEPGMLRAVSLKPAPPVPEGYDPHAFPRVGVTVDVVVLTLRDRRVHVVLIKRGAEPWRGGWALPGGFIHADETLDEAAARELREETGVDASHLEQIGTYGDPGRDPRMRVVTVAYLAVLPRVGKLHGGTDAAAAELVPVDELLGSTPSRTLAFDHRTILEDAVARAREKLSSTSLAAAFVGPEFTLGDLREVYSAWGIEFDPGNFRRKVLSTPSFVEPTGRRAPSGPEGGKPAETYRFWRFARLHPPLQLAIEDPDLQRAAVWRCWIGDDAAFQRALIEKGVLAPVAHGDEVVSDEEWNAFLAGMQVGDYVLAPIARGNVAIGEIQSPLREQAKASDQRLRQVRKVRWRAEIPRSQLPEEFRKRLDMPGVLTPIRITAAGRRVRKLLEES
jgi:8-oxo-dGTP diphosphatase